MRLSHKKFNELVSAFSERCQDETTVNVLVDVIKAVLAYSEDQNTYNPEAYKKLKERKAQKGEPYWNDYRKRYHEQHREEINAKRVIAYHKKKEVQ
jgi:hypothetical protein